jgi:hypothetical protein
MTTTILNKIQEYKKYKDDMHSVTTRLRVKYYLAIKKKSHSLTKWIEEKAKEDFPNL